jgi:primosomal protein N' (replication factor Y)
MDFMRSKYNLRYIDVLRLFLPTKLREEKNPEYTRIFLSPNSKYSCDEAKALIGTRAKKQIELFDFLTEKGGGFLSQMVNLYGVSAVNGLREKGVVTESDVHERRIPLGSLDRKDKVVALTDAQQSAVDQIVSGQGVYLLHGVTGSGKTEIYLHVIEHFLSLGKTSIMLVPEISLTPQTVSRFAARFGKTVAVLHSALSDGERHDEWHRIRRGEARVVVGPRSAIFAPVRNLGLMIVDEEHDSGYKQDESPRYSARDVAVVRATMEKAKCILGSATPSLESWRNATELKKYTLVRMAERAGGGRLPEVVLLNMRDAADPGKPTPIFSPPLIDAMRSRLERGEQIILFLNRRGSAPS